MSWKNKNIYFETSAVNYLVNRFKWYDAAVTKAFQSVRGNRWYLSPVTIWEVLLTSDEVIKEKIIHYSQNLFYKRLLNSPSELIIHFIASGCPREEKRYDFHSKSNIQSVWEDLCLDKKKTFIYDKDELKKRTIYIQDISKQLNEIINKNTFYLNLYDYGSGLQHLLNVCIKKFKKKNIIKEAKMERVFKLSMFFMLYIMCLEIDLDATPIRNFWKHVGISDTFERLQYLNKKYEVLIYRGPFLEMALMAYNQIKDIKTSTRSVFFDCLHSLYLPYIDYFITNDNHFRELKNNVEHFNYKKIFHLKELKLRTFIRKV